MSKVSILFPAYNREHYLEQAIESVIAQTYQNWELLISDNCSTDNTAIIAQKYAEQDKRIKFTRNERNIGSAQNYNKCIADASGDYIELFGADDYFEPTCIEKFVSIFEKMSNVVLVTSAKRHIDGDGQIITEARPYDSSLLIPGDEAIASNIRPLTNWIMSPVMFRAKYKDKGLDLSFGIYSDIDYWSRILAHGDLFYINEILFNYRVHYGSETTARLNNLEFIPTLLRTAERHKKYLLDPDNLKQKPYEVVIDKLMSIVDYSTNTLGLNFDSFFGELFERKSKRDVVENIDEDAKHINSLLNDLHDFKRVSYLALLYASDLRKENEELVADQIKENSLYTGTKTRKELQMENDSLQKRNKDLSDRLHSLLESSSWKITAPLRMMKKSTHQ